jgi:hypothetical protein
MHAHKQELKTTLEGYEWKGGYEGKEEAGLPDRTVSDVEMTVSPFVALRCGQLTPRVIAVAPAATRL